MAFPLASRAASTEIQLGLGPTAYASTWRGDYGAGGTLRLGMRFAHVVGFDFQAWESMASVDTRLNTGLSLGVRGTLPLRAVHPYVRAFLIHQHEEGLVSAQHNPVGILAGIGSGIRHRAGAGGSLGVEIPARQINKRTTITFFTQVNATWLGNDLGPALYLGLDLGVGMDFLL
jgi:hypothetical protein